MVISYSSQSSKIVFIFSSLPEQESIAHTVGGLGYVQRGLKSVETEALKLIFLHTFQFVLMLSI